MVVSNVKLLLLASLTSVSKILFITTLIFKASTNTSYICKLNWLYTRLIIKSGCYTKSQRDVLPLCHKADPFILFIYFFEASIIYLLIICHFTKKIK